MTYLVTGGAGVLGSRVVKRLCKDGHTVKVLDNLSRGRSRRIKDVVGIDEVIQGDIRDFDVVKYAMQGCDSVIHTAYVNGTQTFYAEPREVLDIGIKGMINVLDACAAVGTTELILFSSSEAYQVANKVPTDESVPLTVPDPLNPRYSYGGGKIVCELMANAWARTGILDRCIIIRPHNIYSADMENEHVIPEFARRMKKLIHDYPVGLIPFPIQGTGFETRSFCHVNDFVDGLMAVIEKGEHLNIYHIGKMEEKTIADLAYAIAAYYHRNIELIPGSLPKGSPPRRCPDTSKLERLGYSPSVPFLIGLHETLDWYDTHDELGNTVEN